MNKELLLAIEKVSNQKEIDADTLFSAVEEALAAVTKHRYNEDIQIRVFIDRKTGEHKTFRQWTIVDLDDISNTEIQLDINSDRAKKHKVVVGDVLEDEIQSCKFGRVAAMMARQIIVQKVQNVERMSILNNFKDKIGKIVYGEVRRVSHDFVTLDLGRGSEGIIYKSDLLVNESYRVHDKFRACVLKIDHKKFQIVLSRSSKKMLEALLMIEVPEISEELLDIVRIVRDPGSRSKVSVKSNDKNIDPIGACVGMRGSRIQSIMNELNGERIDIVLWNEDPAQYVINALAPAEVVSIVQDEDKNVMEVAVKERLLSQAIGKNGQNVRLASSLTGWHINVVADVVAVQKQQNELNNVVSKFIKMLDIDTEVAEVLFEAGFTSLEELAYVNTNDMLSIDGLDKETIYELKERAKTALISEVLSVDKPDDDLLKIVGMDYNLAHILAKKGIVTTENLAELSTDDLVEMTAIDEDRAVSLIMKARAPWFEDTK